MTLKLITLDLDDTLWPVEPVLIEAEGSFYHYLSEQEPELFAQISPEDIRSHRLALFEQHPEFQHNVSLWRRESLRQLLATHLSAERAEQLANSAFSVFIQARQGVTLFEDAETILEQLAAQYMLIALTNGNADIERMPVGRLFTAAIRAEDIGVSKPAPDMFIKALEIARCRAEECLHIGDDPYYDIAPARALGMHSLRAAITGKVPADDNSFSHWRELPARIDGLSGR
ncbi:MAG TPA: hypothetical protein DIW43_01605 [Spongiibacteraceae bacterium]|nr:hypothetical protein [Spongiibacteraceae bacterium]HCS26117.1 hypothetical protein [Spongiibacteraceae bacterium]